MPTQKSKRDIPETLLSFFVSRLPEESSQWASAMLAELKTLPAPRERVAWAINGSWGLAKIWLGVSLRRILFDPGKSVPVVLISTYHAIFCCVLLCVIASQIPRVSGPWTEAFFPVLFMLFVSIIPGVIAVGLWLLDDLARYLAIGFSLLHGLGNYALLSTGRIPWASRPVGRIGLDILIVGILILPHIRSAFRAPPIHLSLDS
jgi:hypothetical protein